MQVPSTDCSMGSEKQGLWPFVRQPANLHPVLAATALICIGVGATLLLLPADGVTGGPNWLSVLLSFCGAVAMAVSAYAVRAYRAQLQDLQALDEANYRSLAELVPVGIMMTDGAGNCTFVNQRQCAISGQSIAQSIGKGWQSAIHRDDLAQVVHGWHQLLALGKNFSTEYRLVRSDASEVWVHAQVQRQSRPEGELVGHICATTDITSSKAAESEIKQLAFYDSLTGLPNRRLLMDRLKQAVVAIARTGNCGALLFLDLDNFKTLNDTMGHDKGDMLLQQVSLRLAGSIREGDTVARLGGDEFVLVLENLSPNAQEAAHQAKSIGEKILGSLNQPYILAELEHNSTPSIGITLFDRTRDSVDELMKRADMAMYQAKAAGRNTLRFFDPEMQAVIAARIALERDLRQGLQEHQLSLSYQPQVNAQGSITGVEAFVRWQHPERGMVSPATFIPLAEETGLIISLGNWVLTTACLQLASWGASAKTSHLTMAVKVSPLQFRKLDFVEQVVGILKATQVRPGALKLELNESLLVADVEDIIGKTTALSEHGVGFSLADLGTGYSSLSHLKRLSLDQLRIDQSFVRGLLTNSNDASVARSIFALADSLDLTVSAEGVETREQRHALALHGCHVYQGYLFSQPLSARQFEQLLEELEITESSMNARARV